VNIITPPTVYGLSRKQIILKMLIDAKLDEKPFRYFDGGPGNEVIRSGGYRPMYFFRGPRLGGDAADVRIRELRREHLVPVSDPHIFSDAYYYGYDGEKIRYKIPQYRLELTPKEILQHDWSGAWYVPFKWVFQRLTSSNDSRPVNIIEDADGQRSFA